MSEEKVWVEKMPENCFECPIMADGSEGCDYCVCSILEEKAETKNRLKDCPLHSIKDHDRELVRQVCEKIKDWCNKNFNWVGDGIGYDGQDYNEMIGSNNTINKLRGFLNQIQKEVE